MVSILDKRGLQGQLNSLFTAEDIMLLDAGLVREIWIFLTTPTNYWMAQGTTLEDVLQQDISHPLWSAHLIESDPESIVAAHLAFLQAGSSIILTAT